MKYYNLSKKELEDLISMHNGFDFSCIDDFLKSKPPVLQLNRKEVEKIVFTGIKAIIQSCYQDTEKKVVCKKVDESTLNIITTICNLVPDDFELVASGRYMTDCMVLKFEGYPEPDEKVVCKEYSGKKVLIYIKERKE